ERAIEPARRASEREPGDPYLAYKHVRALIESGRHAEALAVAIGVSEKFPRQPMAAAALATAAAMANDNLRAEPAFKEWVELAPDNPDAVSSYGFFLHRTGRDREAQSLLEAATHKFPAHGNLWLNYSVVLDALGDTNAAEARQQAARLMTDEQRATLVR
ncbi:tetratricopeptide repeat protein, partial [Methylomonas koyamae]